MPHAGKRCNCETTDEETKGKEMWSAVRRGMFVETRREEMISPFRGGMFMPPLKGLVIFFSAGLQTSRAYGAQASRIGRFNQRVNQCVHQRAASPAASWRRVSARESCARRSANSSGVPEKAP